MKPKEIKNILVTRTDRLGDVLLTLPLLDYAKKNFAGSNVYFLVRKYVKDLIENYKDIDEIFYIDDLKTFKEKYKFFKSRNIDLVVFAKPEFELALLFFLLRVRYRIGTGYRWYSFLFNKKVYEHRKTSDKHESDYNLNLLKSFLPDSNFRKEFFFSYKKSEYELLNEKLKGKGLNLADRFIIIHPGSGNSAKDLPVEILKRFVKNFKEQYSGDKIVITGTESERVLAIALLEEQKDMIINLTGELSLKELMILIDSCMLFISNSTGPIHIAGALNKNIVAFYPNKKTTGEVRWKPLSDNLIVLKPSDERDNMNDITEYDILNAAKKFLE